MKDHAVVSVGRTVCIASLSLALSIDSHTDRLLNNPWAQPPLPSDWEVHPTYRKHPVPYYLAPLWDVHVAAEKKTAEATSKTKQAKEATAESQAGKVPKELREKLKKAKAARGLLQALEEEVRKFIKTWEEKKHSTKPVTEEDVMSLDSEDEEIVFVGRNGQMHEIPSPPNPDILKDDKLVFDSAADDHGANFGYVVTLPPFLPATHTHKHKHTQLLTSYFSLTTGVGSSILSDHTMVFEPGPSPLATRRDERPMLGSSPRGELFRPCRAAHTTCLVHCGVWSKQRAQMRFPQLVFMIDCGRKQWRQHIFPSFSRHMFCYFSNHFLSKILEIYGYTDILSYSKPSPQSICYLLQR